MLVVCCFGGACPPKQNEAVLKRVSGTQNTNNNERIRQMEDQFTGTGVIQKSRMARNLRRHSNLPEVAFTVL